MDQPSHSYGLAGTNRHKGGRPERFRGIGVRRSATERTRRGELDAAFGRQTPCSEVLVSFGVFGG